MEAIFPFGFPLPTALYLTIYVGTLALHAVFVGYVLIGAGYLVVTRRSPEIPQRRIRPILTDWMPLMLIGAIVVGIAPLLFVQILYQRSFYTAQLLLFNRWMLILPALCLAVFALSIERSDWLTHRPPWVRAFVALLAFASIASVGYSWTENHLLGVQSSEYYAAFYAADPSRYFEPRLIPRLFVWTFGAMPIFSLVVAWQLFYRSHDGERMIVGVERTLAMIAWGGMILACIATGVVWSMSDFRSGRVAAMAGPYLVATIVGGVLQVGAWYRFRFERGRLIVLTMGAITMLTGMLVTREAIRLDAIGPERLAALLPLHTAASQNGGMGMFVFFFVVNAGLITLCVWIVRNGRKQTDV